MRAVWRRVALAILFSLALGFGLAHATGMAAQNTPTMIRRDGVNLTLPQERRAEAIGNHLRCLVCQNETVENSQAGLAKQFRGIIRRRVVRGESNQHIIAFMVHRYGIFVLLKPPLIPLTMLLWGSPILALLIGLGVLVLARRRREKPVASLDPAEQARLKELLQ
ncbi:MAG TPA: cytochrome c-type biogenesis protein CcmH [Acidiphilium sp.]|nr:MAG: cytochrome C biogenesis protein [Acidiphilium sp. 21-60-14]OYV91213.1 MAG: cytochrome C biogenesis protein [Acidiphilium sp. 37-60-79]OZB39848.1 MAG: cytochrome C biogenesis protein [Acidiphilium sp. 34-60-192]HQT87101.1 cytochrome c-type biogenesis protein CcmH [Acidiphilium sp.]HQU24522.1 cytochrome c-type biogenesis protein CcmH [Acidiphilium sp.]